MNAKRPYKHILKNLLHEQADEIIPLLLPGFQVEQVLNVRMPNRKATLMDQPFNDFDQEVTDLAAAEDAMMDAYMELIGRSSNFERTYLIHNNENDSPCYLIFELQLERDDNTLRLKLLSMYTRMLSYALEDAMESAGPKSANEKQDGLVLMVSEQQRLIYPYILYPFPTATPAPVQDEFYEEVLQAFDFLSINLWEKDAREFLNTRVIASYFLLPAMKNADATLLRLAIEELAQRFKYDTKELGRNLTGLHMMIQLSDTMSDEDKQITQKHLQRFEHLISPDSHDE